MVTSRNVGCSFLTALACIFCLSCSQSNATNTKSPAAIYGLEAFPAVDTSEIPDDEFGKAVKYGRELMLHTAKYIGPDGSTGHYLGNKMNCTNCHQDAGTKPFSINLMQSHSNYPQYRSRENRVLTLADRVNNCIERPHIGKPLPLDSKEMTAFLSYLKWINSLVKPEQEQHPGFKNKKIEFPDSAASFVKGEVLYRMHCQRCHGQNGGGLMNPEKSGYVYPPLWGNLAYQRGSSMHRNIKIAEWLTTNMPYDKVKPGQPFLTDREALDIAAFINNDLLHSRPQPSNSDYANAATKPIDYDKAPFVDGFTEMQHKYGPYKPIIEQAKKQGRKVIY